MARSSLAAKMLTHRNESEKAERVVRLYCRLPVPAGRQAISERSRSSEETAPAVSESQTNDFYVSCIFISKFQK